MSLVLSLFLISSVSAADGNLTVQNITTEYSSGNGAVYAGVNNSLKVSINNTGDQKCDNIIVKLYSNDTQKELATKAINSINAGESIQFYITDPTIRQITENTTLNENNQFVNYILYITYYNGNGYVTSSSNKTAPILYNGNLGKDYEYIINQNDTQRVYDVNGGVIFDTKNDSSYAGGAVLNRTEIWNTTLPSNSRIVEALIYLSYNWDKSFINTGFLSFNATFNGQRLTPIVLYRDQSNLGTYGGYGYGLVVYNVTGLYNLNGNNTLFIEKPNGDTALYPSTLMLLFNTTGGTKKTVYINELADLLATTNNGLGHETGFETSFNIGNSLNNIKNATVYIFASGGQTNEGNLKFNDNLFTNVWNGTSSTANVKILDVTNNLLKNNSVYFEGIGSTILGLHQVLMVEEKLESVLTLNTPTILQGKAAVITATLKDINGGILANQQITLTINKKTYTKTTDSKGIAKFEVKGLKSGKYNTVATYNGNSNTISTKNSKVQTVNGIADLIITKIKKSGNNYLITVKNQGTLSTKTSKLKISYKVGKKTKQKIVSVKGLSPSQSKTVNVKFFKYSTHKKYTKTAIINYNKAIKESNYKNNIRKIKAI